MATLFIFSGLPGSGKTTLSQRLTQKVSGIYLRIDTIEQGLRDLCNLQVEGEGYQLAYKIATDNLKLGMNVIADSCNPIELTRSAWEQVALNTGASFKNIEIVCSDPREHRHRIETRTTCVPGSRQLTWKDIENRVYGSWSKDRIVVDTAGRSELACLEELLLAL